MVDILVKNQEVCVVNNTKQKHLKAYLTTDRLFYFQLLGCYNSLNSKQFGLETIKNSYS